MIQFRCLVNGLLAVVLPTVAVAQFPTADLIRIEPRVATVGETVQIKLIGKDLDQTTELQFTHVGITAVPQWLPADEFFPKRNVESTFKVHVDKGVPPGIYEVRSAGYFGISTARPIVVVDADANELEESGDNTSRDKAMEVSVNSTVNGTVASRGLDWYRFSVKANQTVVVAVVGQRIDSRIDSQLVLYDANGLEVDRNRDALGRDSVLKVHAEIDSVFYVSLSDILFRGGNEHFYRLHIHDQPHVDYVFPPAVEPGATSPVTLHGVNLPGKVAEVSVVQPSHFAAPTGFFPGEPRQGVMPAALFNHANADPVRIGFATAPVVLEDADADFQIIDIPSEIAGRFHHLDDEDVFRFTGHKGQKYCIEVIADRMGVPVDPAVIVQRVDIDEQGNESLVTVAENDDMTSFFSIDGNDSINVDTCDAACVLQAEGDATYQVTIFNQFGDGGPDQIYRLAVRTPKPDFQLIATTERPLATNRAGYSVTPLLRRGGKWGIRILCPRQDEFEGDIVVTAEGLPPGVTAKSLVLTGKTDRGILIVSADMDANSWAGDIRIVGRYGAGTQELIREARFAALVWGHIFADSIRVRSRLTERVPLSINEYEVAPVVIEAAKDKEWSVEVGQDLEIPVRVTDTGSRTGNLTVEPRGLFGMLRNPPTINISEGENEGKLIISFRPNGNFSVAPGTYQFSLHGTGVAKYRQNVRAHEFAQAEQQRIDAIEANLTAELNAANASFEEAQVRLASVRQAAAAVVLGDAVTQAETDVAAAMQSVDQAKQRASELNTKAKALATVRTESEKQVKATGDTAAAKNTNFAAWSDLITVTVVEAKKK